MEIKVLEKTPKRLVFELHGADHTFCGALKKELYNDPAVKVSTYVVEHPLIGIPKFIIETTSKTPEKALIEAAKRLQKMNDKVLEAFKGLRM